MRPALISILIVLSSGCGFLDDDLFLNDEAFEQSLEQEFGSGGIGLVGFGHAGCGGSWGHYRHNYGFGYGGTYRITIRPRISPLPVPSVKTIVETQTTSGSQKKPSDEKQEEIVEVFETEEELWFAFESYLLAGYDVELAQPEELIWAEESGSVLMQ